MSYDIKFRKRTIEYLQACHTIDDVNVHGKTVLYRVDINQPINWETGRLKDTTRVKACVPTLKELSYNGAKLVLSAHQGSDIEYKNFYTTEPHSKVLTEYLGQEVKFIDDVCGPAAREAIRTLKDGEILLLDNVRFVSEEQTLFELKLQLTHEQQARTLLVRKLAQLADLYVCDAFAASHRDQPSLCGFEQVLPSAMGRLFEEEFCVISGLMESPAWPCVFVLGGAKVGDAIMMMSTVLGGGIADKVLAGGLVAQVLLWADEKDIGEPLREFIRKRGYADLVKTAKELLTQYRDKIMLPTDFGYVKDAKRLERLVGSLPNGELVVDIGSQTANEYQKEILAAKTVFVNGPMGVFEKEPSELGTKIIWDALGDTAGYTVDNLYAYIPLKHVNSMYYINMDFYRYYIGREDQSVQENTMIKRIDQQLFVNRLMTSSLSLGEIPEKHKRDYMFHYFEIVTMISSIMLIRSGTEENLLKKQELWRFIKRQNKWLYNKLRYGIMGQIVNLPGYTGRSISVSAYKMSRKVVGFN